MRLKQGSILGAPLILIYINISQTVKSNFFFYGDDTCLVSEHKDIDETGLLT